MSQPPQPPPAPLPHGTPPPYEAPAGQGWSAPAPPGGPAAPHASPPHAPGPFAPGSFAPGFGEAPGQGPAPVVGCRLCGSVPAAPATFRGHQGFLIIMRFLSMTGPFCRDCGMATFRRMTSRTLVQGWYGWASFVITPVTVLINLLRRGRVAHLAAPRPHPYAPSRPPLDPGPRLLQRPLTIVGLAVPFALVMLLILLAGQAS